MPPKAKPSAQPIALPVDDEALIRLRVVLGVFPVSETRWWQGIKDDLYPAPVKLAQKTPAWRVGDIRRLLASPPVRPDSSRPRKARRRPRAKPVSVPNATSTP